MFYRTEGDAVVYNGKGEFVFILPEHYFESRCAIIVGEFVNILGILSYYIEDEKGNKGPLKTFFYPAIFLSQPYTIEKMKNVKLTKNTEEMDYRLLRFKDGDKIIVQQKVPQMIENVEEFFRLFLINGHVPETIPYNRIDEYFREAIDVYGNSYGVHEQMIGLLATEVCRDASDPSKPFRLSKAKKNHDWLNYKNISLNEVPDYISPFVEATSERWDDSIIRATMMDEKDIKSTPLERVLYSK